ncbi:hypothetical protein GCM10007276_12350 [Agaricicola taiwanensis]|uniref:Uncharacterized protein n=1 Tax=Agaricicola taiwanensis TaxID=591372 RepID=A0A8J2VPT7_9RHOB|nr:hypothetical protein [Agaricicola taiwanensis]GGE36393.1 hypothetical protein GCM10007276_12350 [Agaricicola taiwanensis]
MAYLFPRAGTQITKQGQYVPGARLSFFLANTGTPKAVYTDDALTVPHTHPVLADAYGVVPAIYLAENDTYRLRVEDSNGVVLEDYPIIYTDQEGTDSGGGGGDIPDGALLATGDIVLVYSTATIVGRVLLDGSTIGSASSGADRANASYEALYKFLWNNSSADETPLEVIGGRGATADADWSANKPLTLPDYSAIGPIYVKV